MQKSVTFAKKLENEYLKDKEYRKVIVIMQGNIEVLRICNFNYGYHFIIKELAEEFKKTIYLFRRKY